MAQWNETVTRLRREGLLDLLHLKTEVRRHGKADKFTWDLVHIAQSSLGIYRYSGKTIVQSGYQLSLIPATRQRPSSKIGYRAIYIAFYSSQLATIMQP